MRFLGFDFEGKEEKYLKSRLPEESDRFPKGTKPFSLLLQKTKNSKNIGFENE